MDMTEKVSCKIKAFIELITAEYPDIEILENEPMKNHTSFKIGGRVSALVLPKSGEEFSYLVRKCREEDIRYYVIGNGTNMLFADDPLDMVVIKTEKMDAIKLLDNGEIYAECGALLSKIAVFAQKNSLAGFEFAHGIPGSLGGAVCMNAGAYGGEMKDVLKTVTAVRGEYNASECDLTYRHSRFSNSDDYVISAVIKLEQGNSDEIRDKMNELIEKRRASQPLNMPSAGSTFKRPVGGYAAALIDQAGLKGYTVGGAQVSKKHAGFVVNIGDAAFADVIGIMEDIKKIVFDKSGISLEPEVKIVK